MSFIVEPRLGIGQRARQVKKLIPLVLTRTTASLIYRRCRQRIVGPGMLRISTAELFFHLGIRGAPETGQIASHLLRTVVRAEQMQQHRHTPARDARRLAKPKQLLHPDGEYGRLARFVVEPNLTARWER